MDHMMRTLKELFLAIWSEQDEAWRKDSGQNKPSEKAKEALEKVRTMGSFANQLTREALLSRLPDETQLVRDFEREYLLLPPSPKAANFVPLMWMGYDFDFEADRLDARVDVTMFCHVGSELKWLPLRLESGGGMHNFYHAQLENKMVPIKPDWLPGSQPSFPLCAKCPVTLVISLLLTLYGLEETARILTNHNPYRIGHYRKQLEGWVKV